MYQVKTYLDQPFEYKGKKLYADCYLSAEQDDLSPEGDFDFGDAEENAKYLQRFHDGELEMVRLKVTAFFKGFEGSDHLGACHITAKNYTNDCIVICQDYGMVDAALRDLVAHMDSVSEVLAEAANV
jgi:hypothetical protein